MALFQPIQLKLHHYFLQKELQKSHVLRLSSSLDAAKSVGVLVDNADLNTRKTLYAFKDDLQKKGKKVSLLAFNNEKQRTEELDIPHFSKKEVDAFFRPKSEEALAFMNQPFDVLICHNPQGHPVLHFMAAMSKASFRVGLGDHNPAGYELMLDTKKPQDLKNFLSQAEFFLNKMTTHHEPTPA